MHGKKPDRTETSTLMCWSMTGDNGSTLPGLTSSDGLPPQTNQDWAFGLPCMEPMRLCCAADDIWRARMERPYCWHEVSQQSACQS